MIDHAARQEVEELLSWKIDYHHQFQGRENPNIDRLMILLDSHPTLALEVFTENRFTPLEFAITRRLSLDVVREFCARYPKALQKVSASTITEGLPLHVACDLVLSLSHTQELIPFLIDCYPAAVSFPDKEGNLPLHKLLRKYAVRLRPQLLQAGIEGICAEVQALLKVHPESLMIPGSCTVDMTPLEFVLTVHSNILHPKLLRAILELAPPTLTKLQFEGSLGGPGVLTRECAQAFQILMPQLQRIEWELARSALYHPQGWSVFFQSMVHCRSLQHLDIHLPTRILVDDPAGYQATMDTLPQLQSLRSLNLTFAVNRVNEEGQGRIAQLAQPIALLIRQGTLQELSVYSTLPEICLDPIPILSAAVHSKLRALELRPCPPDLDLTTLLVDLLRKAQLTSLALKNVRFQTGPFFQALAQNKTLQCLRVPNLILDTTSQDDKVFRLSQVLQQHNSSLRFVQCVPATLAQRQSWENQQIQYYALLNRFGRAQLRQMSFGTYQGFVEQLTSILSSSDLNRKEHGVLNVTYGILREVPVFWSTN